jgi:Ca2+/Na+ antiporter
MAEEKPPLKEIGDPDYLNKDCWLINTLGYAPAKRCWYCDLKFKDCPFTSYLWVSLVLCLFSFAVLFFFDGKITRTDVFVVFAMVLAYGYFSTKSTEKVIEVNFSEKQAKIALEKAKASLEVKIAERTKELEDLTKNLGQQVDTRTKELEEKLKELKKINSLAVGRELKMIELKRKIRELEEKTKKLQEAAEKPG